jgi:putative glycosyltransferase (TIGR04348 family)
VRITIVTPRRPGASSGNDVTAARWRRRFEELGHTVEIIALTADEGDGFVVRDLDLGTDPDLIVVIHARRCAAAVATSQATAPDRPVVVALAGTDLYGDLPEDADARAAIDTADHLVVLQAAAIERLAGFDPALAAKAHVVHQSVDGPIPPRREPEGFVVAVLAHLRDVKDPLLAARAAARLPAASRVRVVHAGAAHDDSWEAAARREERDNPRYRWLGELPREEARELLAGATVLACTSLLEGGANVVTEAIALGVPVVGTAIDGNRGLLGADYPGLVAVGDDEALSGLLGRLETDSGALAELQARVDALEGITAPAHERDAWLSVLSSLSG